MVNTLSGLSKFVKLARSVTRSKTTFSSTLISSAPTKSNLNVSEVSFLSKIYIWHLIYLLLMNSCTEKNGLLFFCCHFACFKSIFQIIKDSSYKRIKEKWTFKKSNLKSDLHQFWLKLTYICSNWLCHVQAVRMQLYFYILRQKAYTLNGQSCWIFDDKKRWSLSISRTW